jgi:tripartite-type tricarboxylate transporter receptor subunit TctC
MTLSRRTLLAAPALLPLAAGAQTQATAPWQPNRQLRLIVPFSPGGSTDV